MADLGTAPGNSSFVSRYNDACNAYNVVLYKVLSCHIEALSEGEQDV